MHIIADENDLAYGLEQLIQIDPNFKIIAEKAGRLPLRKIAAGFEGLSSVIVSQMVSRASADAIWMRLTTALVDFSPQAYITLTEADARRFGLSGAKHATLSRLASALIDLSLDLQGLEKMDGVHARQSLQSVKGIGPWTSDVYLLFALGHPDVFPVGDVAIQAAYAHAHSKPVRPSASELSEIAANWQPWRSIAARALWAYYGAVMNRSSAILG